MIVLEGFWLAIAIVIYWVPYHRPRKTRLLIAAGFFIVATLVSIGLVYRFAGEPSGESVMWSSEQVEQEHDAPP